MFIIGECATHSLLFI